MSGIEEKEFRFAGADGHPVAAWRWSKPVRARAVLQVAHGMGEHARRYKQPLEPLMDAGIVVYANDHRGHGLTAPSKEALGTFGAGGFTALVDDQETLFGPVRAGETFEFNGLIMYELEDDRFRDILVAYNSFEHTDASGVTRDLGIPH